MTATQRHWMFWLALFTVTVLFLWMTSDVLLPFVAGLAIAYFLDPIADRIEQFGAPRWLATTLVLLLFALLVVLALLVIVPVIQQQVTGLIQAIPGYVEQFQNEVLPVIQRYVQRLSSEDANRIREAAGNFTGTAVSWAGDLVTALLSGGFALFDIISLLFITPIVAFYLLRDWDNMVRRVDDWLPRPHADAIRAELNAIDETLAGFVRGQATVCIALGVFYALALSIAGLQFGLVIGLVAGLLSFIPYVGSLVGFAASIGVALFQFDDYTRVAIIVGIFFLGQAIEGNFLAPKLVGERVGLHPVWVMFALLAGGSLFGFLGVLLGVPVAAVIGVLVRFGMRHYLASPYYTGTAVAAAPEEQVPAKAASST